MGTGASRIDRERRISFSTKVPDNPTSQPTIRPVTTTLNVAWDDGFRKVTAIESAAHGRTGSGVNSNEAQIRSLPYQLEIQMIDMVSDEDGLVRETATLAREVAQSSHQPDNMSLFSRRRGNYQIKDKVKVVARKGL